MSVTALSPATTDSTNSAFDLLSPIESYWLQALYREGFDALFGSWMGRDGCPFLYVQFTLRFHLTLLGLQSTV